MAARPPTRSTATEMAAELQAVLETVVDAIVTINEAGLIRTVNPATERMFGYSRDELIGQNVSILMPSPYREEHDQFIASYLRTGQPKIIGVGREIVARRKDGAVFPIDLAVSEVFLDDTRVFTGVIRDMTDRKRTEAQLQIEREFSNSLIDTAHAIVLLLDGYGRVLRINPFMEHLSGYTNSEARGRDWFETFIPERDREHIRELFRNTIAGKPVHGNVNPIVTRNGEERLITWSGRRLLDGHDRVIGVIAIGNDVTELREAQQKLIQTERLAAIGQMMTGLAHESRNALQRSRACLEMLELDVSSRPELVDLVHRAQHALDELQRLYEEVRSYAAPLQLERRLCALSAVWSETWEHLAHLRQDRNVQLRTTADEAATICPVDRQRIQQVFRNILENALEVAPDGSEVEISCRSTQLRGQPALAITVRDSGPGISPADRERVFEPFFSTKTKGTGLGMAIARRIVEAHGGTITVAVNDSPGAAIRVMLPR